LASRACGNHSYQSADGHNSAWFDQLARYRSGCRHLEYIGDFGGLNLTKIGTLREINALGHMPPDQGTLSHGKTPLRHQYRLYCPGHALSLSAVSASVDVLSSTSTSFGAR
jgi:hypothetical protein